MLMVVVCKLLKITLINNIIYGFNPIIKTMTTVHSQVPWKQPQQERLAPKERTHPMRTLSRNNNTTTSLKRGPNPLSEVLIPRPWEVVILSLLSMSPSSPQATERS